MMPEQLKADSPTQYDGARVTQWDEDGLAHVLPKLGPKHELNMSCWCHPVVDPDRYMGPVVAHNIAQ